MKTLKLAESRTSIVPKWALNHKEVRSQDKKVLRLTEKSLIGLAFGDIFMQTIAITKLIRIHRSNNLKNNLHIDICLPSLLIAT